MALGNPQLAALRAQLDDATARARRLVETSDAKTFGLRPEPMAWSAAECLEHVSLTTKGYLPLIDEVFARTDVRKVPADHRYARDWMGALLAWYLEPPYRMKSKTLSPFVPPAVRPGQKVLAEFATLQDELAARIDAAHGRDLGAMRITSPFSERIRYNMFSTFGVLLAHERRHLWQAEQTLARIAPT